MNFLETLNQFLSSIESLPAKKYIFGALSAMLILLIGVYVARRVSHAVMRTNRLDIQQKLLFQKVIYYGLVGVAIAWALSELGIDLKVLLGAAGLLTVAVGFAAQTSASNLISGLFLIIDRPFIVGDVIEVGGVTGEILSIDLLSFKIRTFDNILVRVPNETMVKSDIKNLTFFPIRRIDIKFGVGYSSKIQQVEEIVRGVATRNPLCLEDPAPLFIFQGFGDSSLNIQFSVWAIRTNILELQNRIMREIKEALDQAGVEIPFPHRTLVMSQPGQAPAKGQDLSSPR